MSMHWQRRLFGVCLVVALAVGWQVLRDGLRPVPQIHESMQPVTTTVTSRPSEAPPLEVRRNKRSLAPPEGGRSASLSSTDASQEAGQAWAEFQYVEPELHPSPVSTTQVTEPMAWPGEPVPPDPFVEPEMVQDPHRGDREWGIDGDG